MTCSGHRRAESENLKERMSLGDLDQDGRITFKETVFLGVALIHMEQVSDPGPSENNNEPSTSVKFSKILDPLSIISLSRRKSLHHGVK
jgi:hypothetical protein